MGKLAATASTSSSADKEKSLKIESGDPVEGANQAGHSTEKRKKRSKKDKEPERLEVEIASVETLKTEKKRKRRDANSANLTSAVYEEPQIIEEPPRKKRKNRTEFSDPRVDASLSDQTRKALEYAFTQLNKPKKWKFSKARQNWIIRNVWSPESVPEPYFLLALTYLGKVQGGSREKLKEVAQGYLEPKPDPSTTPSKVSASDTPPEPNLNERPPTKAKKVTFGPLIDATPKPGALIDQLPAKKAVASVDANKLDSEEVRRRRAQDVLKALESSPVS